MPLHGPLVIFIGVAIYTASVTGVIINTCVFCLVIRHKRLRELSVGGLIILGKSVNKTFLDDDKPEVYYTSCRGVQ